MSRVRATIAVTYPVDPDLFHGSLSIVNADGEATAYAEGLFSAEDMLLSARRQGHQIDVTFEDLP